MDPDRFLKIERLFMEARACPAPERAAFLAAHAADDPDLVRHVQALLDEEDSAAAAALERPALGTGFHLGVTAGEGPPLPERLGPFRILRVLGEGGMGVVYEGEQDRPRRRVAVKVLRSALAGRQALKRFEHEAQVLARLTHPGIARIFEAGEADLGHGRQPYFAMELVPGRPITDYARQHGLNVREKMELLARVCDAVQHAHAHGVVHRDLKPGNVLVQDEAPQTGADRAPGAVGTPKILDFGVARLTDADLMVTTVQTASGQLIGTLPYMSPEQVAGDPARVDARSDVYALGVLVHELLTGKLPYDLSHKSVPEAALAIRETEPRMLGTIDRSLRGDPETIAAKALEKDPLRRYQSASELAQDIRRWLSDQPITARPPSAVYQLRKFARRNRALVTGVAVAMLAIVAGAAVAARQAVIATRQRDAARAAQRRAEGIRDFLVRDVFGRTGFEKDGPNVKAADLLRGAGSRVSERFKDDPDMLAEVEALLGRLGTTMGDDAFGAEHARRSLELLEQRRGPESPEALRARIDWFGSIINAEDVKQVEAAAGTLVEPVERVFGPRSREALHARIHEASACLVLNRPRECAAKAEAILRDFDGQNPIDPENYGVALNLAVASHRTLGERPETLEAARRALEFAEKHEAPDAITLLDHRMIYGQSLWFADHPAEAETVLREVLARQKQIYTPDDPTLAHTQISLGLACEELGKLDDADAFLSEAARIMGTSFGEGHYEACNARRRYYGMLDRTGQRDKQERWVAEELERLQRLDKAPTDPMVIDTRCKKAALLLATERPQAAAEEVDAVEALVRDWPKDKDPPLRATIDILAGRVLAFRGRVEEGRQRIEAGLAVHSGINSAGSRRMAEMARQALKDLPTAAPGAETPPPGP